MRHVPVPPEAAAEFGRRINSLRLSQGMTEAAACAALGLRHPHVLNLEKGVRNPSFGALLALARLYGVDPAVLVTGLHVIEAR